GLEPKVLEIDPAEVGDALRAGELDLALVHEYDFVAGDPEPGVATEALCIEAMYLASAAVVGGEVARGEAVDAGAIGGCREEPWITATPGTLCHRMTVRACETAGFTPYARHQVDDYTTVLALVAAGQGVALVPQLALMELPDGVAVTRT